MCGGGIKIEVALLNVFSMVPLRAAQTKQALLKYRVTFVPERD
jgi:hypothetical protein